MPRHLLRIRQSDSRNHLKTLASSNLPRVALVNIAEKRLQLSIVFFVLWIISEKAAHACSSNHLLFHILNFESDVGSLFIILSYRSRQWQSLHKPLTSPASDSPVRTFGLKMVRACSGWHSLNGYKEKKKKAVLSVLRFKLHCISELI